MKFLSILGLTMVVSQALRTERSHEYKETKKYPNEFFGTCCTRNNGEECGTLIK